MKVAFTVFNCFSFVALPISIVLAQTSSFDGLGMHLGNLSRLSRAKTRSISPENFTGEKGKGGMSNDGPAADAARELGQGWKVSPYIRIEPKGTVVLANIEGRTYGQHRSRKRAPG